MKRKIKEWFISSLKKRYFYGDFEYKTLIKFENNEFTSLFNLYYIQANRPIDDEKFDKVKSISRKMIDYVSNDAEWKVLEEQLPDQLIESIQNSGIQNKIHEKSIKPIAVILDAMAKTNGGSKEQIKINLNFTNEALKSIITSIMSANYEIDGITFKENSRGLGYNNMIYMHLQLQGYILDFDPTIVNLFVIEEPECHMHPQMQRAFIKYLMTYYKNLGIQGMITTHSSEIVKSSVLDKIRVIRKESGSFYSDIFDMNIFLNSIKSDTLKTDEDSVFLNEFYNFFFSINFSDIIFGDKAILYEGDTERMYLKKILELDQYQQLSREYIAFVQVGGAYAHNYESLIKFLKIKTLILTDIDYKKELIIIDDILKSTTTNTSINYFYLKLRGSQTKPKIKSILRYMSSDVIHSEYINIKFQGENDQYTRTLEESMLAKYYGMTVEEEITTKTWRKLRLDSKIRFSIPNGITKCSIRKIVQSTSNTKTDFMYSVIVNGLVEETLPYYIKEGLDWLM